MERRGDPLDAAGTARERENRGRSPRAAGGHSRHRTPSASAWLCVAFASTTLLGGCHRNPDVAKRKYLESGKRYAAAGKMDPAVIQFGNALRIDGNWAEAHFELGKADAALHRNAQAQAELSRAVQLQPGNAPAHLALGQVLLQLRQPAAAEQQANYVAAVDPANAAAHALLSAVAGSKGDTPAALVEIRKAAALAPNSGTYRAELGRLEGLDETQLPEAEADLRAAVGLEPGNGSAHRGLAELLEHRGDLSGAEAQYREAVAAGPKDSDSADALLAFYQRRGQAGVAETVFSQLLKAHPGSLPLALDGARAAMEQGDFAKAETLVNSVSKTHGDDIRVAEFHSTLLQHEGRWDQAVAVLKAAAGASPDDADVRVMLGQVAQLRGDLPLAETSFAEAAQRDPRNLTAQRGLAALATQRGENSLLRQLADTVQGFDPGLPEPYLWRGIAEENDGHLEIAAADFSQALTKAPNMADALMRLGDVRLQQHRGAEGQALLTRALAGDPASPALHLMVQEDMAAKHPERALDRIRKQIALDPGEARLYDELAAVQADTGDTVGAIASAGKAMQLNASDSAAVRLFTSGEIKAGKLEAAEQAWRGWADHHPNDPEGYSMLGMLSEAMGDPDGAIVQYRKALALDPDQPTAADNLALLMVDNHEDLGEALTLAQGAQRSRPDAPETQDALAWVYYHQGLYDAARALLETASKADPTDSFVQYHLGMTYSKLGNRAAAAAHLTQAASLEPGSPVASDAQQALTQLH